MRWLTGVDDTWTHTKDKYTWQFEQWGDPMARFIQQKAYNC